MGLADAVFEVVEVVRKWVRHGLIWLYEVVAEIVAFVLRPRPPQPSDDSSSNASDPLLGTPNLMSTSLHKSCRSDPYDEGEDMAGVILWAYDSELEWELNGVKCKSGYVYQKQSKNLESISSGMGQIHGKLYRSLFGVEPDTAKVVATGYSVQGGKVKVISGVFNSSSVYHDQRKEGTDAEMAIVAEIVEQIPGTTKPMTK
eukprot:UN0531